MYFFLGLAAALSLFGLDALRSVRGLTSFFFFSISTTFFAEAFLQPKGYRALLCLFSGQAIAGIFGVFQSAYPEQLQRIFLGRIAESGQMALTLVLAIGTLLIFGKAKDPLPWPAFAARPSRPGFEVLFGFFIAALLIVTGFSASSNQLTAFRPLLAGGSAVLLIGAAAAGILQARRAGAGAAWYTMLYTVIVPGIMGGLLVNLKRGPWLGVTVAISLLLLRFERRVLLPVLAITIIAATAIAPVRNRLTKASEHFFIYGGRSVIWEVGAELAPRYPLGVGYKNSRILREFSEQIPKELTHFHNNAINIMVETGILGFLAFAWWLARLMRTGFSSRTHSRILSYSAGLAILSWQLAGLVEYNAGDSEVMLVVYLIVGLLSALSTKAEAGTTKERITDGGT